VATALRLSYDVLVTPRQATVGEFGDKFRKAREKKELSLDDVSNVTKISSRMLQAIEEEHFDRLPGGVFNKGFIRAYAKHLGLNDEEAVTDYLACLRQAQIDAHEVWQPERPAQIHPAPPERPRLSAPNKPAIQSQPPAPVEELPELQLPRAEDVRPRRREFSGKPTQEIPWRIVDITAVVIILGVILWTRRTHNTNTAAASTLPAKTASATSPQATTAPATTALSPLASTSTAAPKNPPATTPGSTPTPEHSSAPHAQPAQRTESAATTQAGAAASTTPSAAEADYRNDVTVRTFPKSKPQPSEKAAAALTLVIRATETSWISVLADGQTVSQETLIAPAHTSVHASHEIVARIGNAAGVTFLWNGQEIPAVGAEGEVKTFVFDSNGMRVLPTIQSPAQNR
jgi:cytoskeletal protein RodZ